MIIIDEIHRCGSLGVGQGLCGGLQIGRCDLSSRQQLVLFCRDRGIGSMRGYQKSGEILTASPSCTLQSLGLPPVFNYGSQELQDRVLPEILSGKKRICLAITEPTVSSDCLNPDRAKYLPL